MKLLTEDSFPAYLSNAQETNDINESMSVMSHGDFASFDRDLAVLKMPPDIIGRKKKVQPNLT